MPMDGSGVDTIVLLNTGMFPIGADVQMSGYFVPIWRIDDGAVFGIPWEQCQGALERSQEAVGKGFPASWPNLQCANVSYTGPDSSFSHVISLAQGPHTLWTGILAMVSTVISRNLVQIWSEICFPTSKDACRLATRTRAGSKPGLKWLAPLDHSIHPCPKRESCRLRLYPKRIEPSLRPAALNNFQDARPATKRA